MDNNKNSIQRRFIFASLIIGIVLILSTLFAQYYVSQLTSLRTSNIQERQTVISHIRLIRNTLWQADNTLNEHLLRPIPSVEIIWTKKYQRIKKYTLLLHKTDWIKNQKIRNITSKLKDSLKVYYDESIALMRLRLNAAEQHPALYYARETMLPHNRKFTTAATLALEEIVENTNDLSNPLFKDILLARHLWIQIISNFRMYIVNRLGSFDVRNLPIQARDIDTLYRQLMEVINRLAERNKTEELDIQTSQSIKEMLETAIAWNKDFQVVKNIHQSKNWRTDIVIIKDIIQPLERDIHSYIQELENILEKSTGDDISALATMADRIVNALWLLLVIGLLVIFTGFGFLNRAIIKPIATVAQALKAEATGKQNIMLPRIDSEEIQDLTEAFSILRKQVHNRQAALEYQAMHDALTGLPNRSLLHDRAQQAINKLHREKGSLALFMMDLDRFKEINDTLGHQVGDQILEQVGLRLVTTLRETDTVARLGGDEFAILAPIKDRSHSIDIAEKVTDTLEKQFNIDGHQLYIGASIGIAIYPEHGDEISTLIQRADVAMYEAKRKNQGYATYDPILDRDNMGRLSLANDLRNALESKSLSIYFQPKLKIATDRPIGCEALLRWNHPERGFVPPDELIYIAEHTGLIKPLTNWVLKQAIENCSDWNKKGLKISVSINLSVHNLQDPFLVPQIEQLLEQYNLPPEKLVIEVTESAMMIEPERANETLRKLDRMGVWISIDDFGTGFSSLAYLKQLPVDELKIDKSFTMNMNSNDNDAVIVRSTIDLAKNLGLKVVAEGVEDNETYNILKRLGCDYAQGYYMSKPLPIDDFLAWLDTHGKGFQSS